MSRSTLIATLAALGLLPVLGAAPAAVAKNKVKTTTCDNVDPRYCMLPWPNNHFTVSNDNTESGKQLRLPAFRPQNASGKRVDPFPYTLSDGFSPGGPILTHVPGVDLKVTGAVPLTDLRSYDERNAPILLIDAATRKRQMIWAELDAGADRPSEQLLMIHLAKNLVEGRRYIVALRNMRGSDGKLLKASKSFLALRSGARRSKRYASIFRTLGQHRVDRSSLYLAWDFTVASQRNISERVAWIRDKAFSVLGDSNLFDRKIKGKPPAFSIDSVQDLAPCGADGCQPGENDLLARQVTGTLTTACYLDKPGCPPGSKFRFRKRRGRYGFVFVPNRQKRNTMKTTFVCIVPRAALTKPARASLYGHDVFGSPAEVLAPAVQAMAQEYNMVFCSTRQSGMSDQDKSYFESALRDVSRFPAVADRLQQGLLNNLLLGRAMVHPDGLAARSAFQAPGGAPLYDIKRLYHDSSGQGGNFGAALTALAPDFQRSVLGTAGMRYSLIMPRSVDFDSYNAVLASAYPGRMQRMVVLAMIQGLWDRGEANGYAARMVGDPPPRTPIHNVLIQSAVGDPHTPQISSEIMARTAEATIREPAFDDGRFADKIPFFGFNPMPRLELGSGIVMWDSGPVRPGGLGTDLAPVENVPPRSGHDPHGLVPLSPAVRKQKSDFLEPLGRVREVCLTRRACRLESYPY